MGRAARIASRQHASVRATSRAGISRSAPRTKLRRMSATTTANEPTIASHHMCQTRPNDAIAPATPMTTPAMLPLGTAIASKRSGAG